MPLGRGRPRANSVTDPLSSLLQASHLLTPSELAATVAAHARAIGARQTVLYLADYEQVTLLPLPGTGVPERQEVPIAGTLPGRAFQRVETIPSRATQGTHRLWVPLVHGAERLGVAELVLAEQPDVARQHRLQVFLTLVAELLVATDAYTDVFARLRRRKTLSLAAEMQWELLPPRTFGTERVVITGGLEPAYDIGGDSFDYAVNAAQAELLVLDSVGHGLPAAVLASVAISAYRHARRNMLDLPDMVAEINAAIAYQFGASRFATAASPASTSTPGGCAGSTLATPSRSSCAAPRSSGRRTALRRVRWACRTPRPSAARPGWNPATGCCSTPTASPRPAPPTGSSSASNGSPTSSPPPSQPANPRPRPSAG